MIGACCTIPTPQKAIVVRWVGEKPIMVEAVSRQSEAVECQRDRDRRKATGSAGLDPDMQALPRSSVARSSLALPAIRTPSNRPIRSSSLNSSR
jgi:hypothetical protein